MEIKVKKLDFRQGKNDLLGDWGWVAKGYDCSYTIEFHEEMKHYELWRVSDNSRDTYKGEYDTLNEAKEAAQKEYQNSVDRVIGRLIASLSYHVETKDE